MSEDEKIDVESIALLKCSNKIKNIVDKSVNEIKELVNRYENKKVKKIIFTRYLGDLDNQEHLVRAVKTLRKEVDKNLGLKWAKETILLLQIGWPVELIVCENEMNFRDLNEWFEWKIFDVICMDVRQ